MLKAGNWQLAAEGKDIRLADRTRVLLFGPSYCIWARIRRLPAALSLSKSEREGR